MAYYCDDPPPPDMAFPGWEGPVFVAQLFGISDTAAALWVVDCAGWKVVGFVWVAFGPVAFLVFVTFRVRSLVKVRTTLDQLLNPKPGTRNPKRVYQTMVLNH